MSNLIKVWFSEVQVESTNSSHKMVKSIGNISYDALAKQVAFRNLKDISEVNSIECDSFNNITMNGNYSCGNIDEYYSTLEEYKESIK